jgi:hypothetical protein
MAMPQAADQLGGQFLISEQSSPEPQGLRRLQASTGNRHDCVRAVQGKASAGAKIKIQKRRKEKSKMVNPEHLAKLKEGVAAWNKWRIAH